MVSYYKTNVIKLITVLRTPLFDKFIQNKDNIFRLAREGNSQRITEYIQGGGDPDLPGHWHVKSNRTETFTMRWSLLCEGAAFGHLLVLKLLAKAVGVKNVAKMSLALWIACRYGHLRLVEWLLEHTRCVVASCPRDLLLTSVENGHFDIAKYLLERDLFTDVNAKNDDEDTLLNIVISRQAEDGRSALHVAAELNDVDAAVFLLKGGRCYVDVRDNNGLTPLHVACQMGHRHVAEVLLYYDADGSVCNNFGQNCVDIALSAGYNSLAAYVREPLSAMRLANKFGQKRAESKLNTSTAAAVCRKCSPVQVFMHRIVHQLKHTTNSVLLSIRHKVSTPRSEEDELLSVSDWEIFYVVVDELASRLLGKFRKGIRVAKVSGIGETCLNEVQFGQLTYIMLTGMRFGKGLVLANIHKFWEESLNRITSLIIARRTDESVLIKNNTLLLQIIELFRKLFEESLPNEKSTFENSQVTLDDFERNVERVISFTRRLANDDKALMILVCHLKLPNSETLNFGRCQASFKSENQTQSIGSYEWREGGGKGGGGNKSLIVMPNSTSNVRDRQDIKSGNSETLFTREDAEQLVTTIATSHRVFLQHVDLKILYSLWVSYFAFFWHMRSAKSQFGFNAELIITVMSIILLFTLLLLVLLFW